MHEIAVLPGDGIGHEIMEEAIKVINTVEKRFNIAFKLNHALVGGAAWDKYRKHLPEETLDICEKSNAILFGAVGGPVKEQTSSKWCGTEVNALLGLRKHFGLYANLRPAKLYPALAFASSLRDDIAKEGFDLLVVRELTGGIYFGKPKGRMGKGEDEYAFDTMIYKRGEIKRIAQVAFKAARNRRRKVTSIDKANVLTTMVLWREVVDDIAKEYPDIEYEPMYVDNAAMQLTRNPKKFDVILCGNLFGDILSDEAAAITGSLGMSPSASLSEGNFGMYEPSGGSAQDIAGKGIANPIAQILSTAMMLRYSFDMNEEANSIENAVDKVLIDGYRTPDIIQKRMKKVNTKEMGTLIAGNI